MKVVTLEMDRNPALVNPSFGSKQLLPPAIPSESGVKPPHSKA